MKTPILETDRMILRPLTVEDSEHVFKSWTSDPEVARYMVWDVHENIEETINWLKSEQEALDSDINYTWGIMDKKTNKLFGSIGLNYKEDDDSYTFGYNIMKVYWGKGLTTEAGHRVLEFAKEELGIKKFFCRHAVENIGSMKVMTKLGFKYSNDSTYESYSGKKKFNSKDYYLYV